MLSASVQMCIDIKVGRLPLLSLGVLKLMALILTNIQVRTLEIN
jgi:hypothetical protein